MTSSLHSFIKSLPKAELHLHLEGTFEPELMFEIAQRNNITLKYNSVDDLRKAYSFSNLQEFLDIYYEGAGVLLHEQDFYDLTWAYLKRVHEENVVHVEVFFDPQTHTGRGVPFETVLSGIRNALEDGQHTLGISFKLIMCFLRHLSQREAFKTLEMAVPHLDKIDGVGLDSSEVGNPPSKFESVFEKARELGLPAVVHAGEEGPSDYIWGALNKLNAVRIDHGNRCLDDDLLVKRLSSLKMPLTLCPLSNVALKVVPNLDNYPLVYMMNRGLLVTINSDDPAYFGGYLTDNYVAVAEALQLSENQIIELVRNSFMASWLPDNEKSMQLNRVDEMGMSLS